jgi:predicted Rossmann-fold nucleotide-binding protein
MAKIKCLVRAGRNPETFILGNVRYQWGHGVWEIEEEIAKQIAIQPKYRNVFEILKDAKIAEAAAEEVKAEKEAAKAEETKPEKKKVKGKK